MLNFITVYKTVSSMSQLDSIIYNTLSLPTDLCNIITSYANEHVRKILVDNIAYYKYEDKLIPYNSYSVIGIVNNVPYIFKLPCYGKFLYMADLQHTKVIKVLNTDKIIDRLYFTNYLICQHICSISIYDINSELTLITSIDLNSNLYRLIYADCNWIIVLSYTNHLHIYNTNLELLGNIHVHNGGIRDVSLVDDVLSYYTDSWHAIGI